MQSMADLLERTESLESDEVQQIREFEAEMVANGEPSAAIPTGGPNVSISPARERALEREAQRDLELLREAQAVAGYEPADANAGVNARENGGRE